MLSSASIPMAVRVSIVAALMCGSRNVFCSDRYHGFSFGSPSYVSRPAAATWPLLRAAIRSSSTTMPPLAAFATIAPRGKMCRTVVAYFAENISAACLEGALNLGDGSNSWIATGNGQGSTGARSKKDCAAHAVSARTKIAQAPAPGPIVLPRRNAFPLTSYFLTSCGAVEESSCDKLS
jgi:hypothetical protein